MTSVADFMTRLPLTTVPPTMGAADALRIASRQGISHLMVTRGTTSELLGVVCVCDLDQAPQRASVAECMRSEPETIEAGHSVEDALARMAGQHISCLPVTDGARLRGVITLSDLRRAGFVDAAAGVCMACGSDDHVRCADHLQLVPFCHECERRSQPPGFGDDVGGSG